MDKLSKCKCGGKARIRRKKGVLWIHCNKCNISTGVYVDLKEPFDTKAEERAIIEWDKMNGGTDGGNLL